jgi:hypothetical protein
MDFSFFKLADAKQSWICTIATKQVVPCLLQEKLNVFQSHPKGSGIFYCFCLATTTSIPFLVRPTMVISAFLLLLPIQEAKKRKKKKQQSLATHLYIISTSHDSIGAVSLENCQQRQLSLGFQNPTQKCKSTLFLKG